MDNGQMTVLVGVTGCIAAYKACEIVRGLQKAGVRVKVVMTPHATEFVGPTTFRALTNEPVAVDLFDEPGAPIHHVSLAKEADLFLIAPCTGNVVAKLAHGVADDLLTTTAPLVIAPAMNVNMYEADTTQENFVALRARGVEIIDAEEGYLACGDTGKGRLAEPATIVARVLEQLALCRSMEGLRVLVTAGPTREAIDPVRYISNHSSGKQGYAIAKAAAKRGAQVTLVSGPVALDPPAGVQVVPVTTACEMLEAAQAAFAEADIAVFTAAVADFRPAQPADRKLKKGSDDAALTTLQLTPNPDILATLAHTKALNQVVVGFAAETENALENGRKKLVAKAADLIVANPVGKGIGFGTNTNSAHLITATGETEVPETTKDALAAKVLEAALKLRRN
ncbi:MAG: bifunctional phosphopantothenoylcysteine decarboxylase/phosphopantothenate--cysteine ligase CoaBC [Coriobacteriia bacterium]|nr:bifunctional phosphopantothenoylcysteine decarboxylase/phosphopantothenate--cysteine ligase CoaBC [Coriobacteriia bacterium]